ncbi:MAG: hypothetical protein LW837_28175 [Roseomonas sp.]|nr:hypothetical protein [Roseomonas sp.]
MRRIIAQHRQCRGVIGIKTAGARFSELPFAQLVAIGQGIANRRMPAGLGQAPQIPPDIINQTKGAKGLGGGARAQQMERGEYLPPFMPAHLLHPVTRHVAERRAIRGADDARDHSRPPGARQGQRRRQAMRLPFIGIIGVQHGHKAALSQSQRPVARGRRARGNWPNRGKDQSWVGRQAFPVIRAII